MSDETKLLLIASGFMLIAMILLSAALSFFVALRAPPARRAAWTAGLAALGTALLLGWAETSLALNDEPELETLRWTVPLAAIPCALLVFLYWRRSFHRAWAEDADALTGKLENDDWKGGLLRLAILLALATIAAFRRFLLQSGWF